LVLMRSKRRGYWLDLFLDLGDLLLLRKKNGEGKVERIVEWEANTNVQKMGVLVWSMEWVFMICTNEINAQAQDI